MSYKIAVASSDGAYIDQSFGAADRFLIYRVFGPGNYRLEESRPWSGVPDTAESACAGCGSGAGVCGGHGSAKAALLRDVRCLVCGKIGFQAQRQLERRAVTVFDIACPIREALDKITDYLDRADRHQRLRKAAPPAGNGGM